MEEQNLHEFQKALKSNFKKNTSGYCYECNTHGRYVASHSVQESVLKKMMHSNCVKVIQKWNLTFAIRLSNLKSREISTKTGPSEAGVFYLLCKDCEKSDNYENKLLNNLYTSFNQKDLKDIYLKSLYHALYNVRIKEGLIPLLDQSRGRDLDYAKDYLENEKKRLDKEIKNHSSQKYILLYDSIAHKGESVKFNFSSLINVSSMNNDSIALFVLPDNHGPSRVIMIAPNTKQNRKNKSSFLQINKNSFLKTLIYDLFKFKTLGVVFYGDIDTTRIIESFTKMDQVSSKLKQIDPLFNITTTPEFTNFYNSLIREK